MLPALCWSPLPFVNMCLLELNTEFQMQTCCLCSVRDVMLILASRDFATTSHCQLLYHFWVSCWDSAYKLTQNRSWESHFLSCKSLHFFIFYFLQYSLSRKRTPVISVLRIQIPQIGLRLFYPRPTTRQLPRRLMNESSCIQDWTKADALCLK